MVSTNYRVSLEIKKFKQLLKKSSIVLVYTSTCKKEETLFLKKNIGIKFKRFSKKLLKSYLIKKYKILPQDYAIIGSYVVLYNLKQDDFDSSFLKSFQKLNKNYFFCIGGHIDNVLFNNSSFTELFLKKAKLNNLLLNKNYLENELVYFQTKQVFNLINILKYQVYCLIFGLKNKN